MTLPRFTAEVSLYRTSEDYARLSTKASNPSGGSVTPQQCRPAGPCACAGSDCYCPLYCPGGHLLQ